MGRGISSKAISETLSTGEWADRAFIPMPAGPGLYVVESERISLRRHQLENSGFLLLAVKNVFDALDVFMIGTIDAVVFEGENLMNCDLVVQKMRESNRSTPLLLCSSASTLRTRTAKMFDRCIWGSVSIEALTSAIREALSTNQVLPSVSPATLVQFDSEVRH